MYQRRDSTTPSLNVHQLDRPLQILHASFSISHTLGIAVFIIKLNSRCNSHSRTTCKITEPRSTCTRFWFRPSHSLYDCYLSSPPTNAPVIKYNVGDARNNYCFNDSFNLEIDLLNLHAQANHLSWLICSTQVDGAFAILLLQCKNI